LIALGFVLILAGIALLASGLALGWLVGGLAAIPIMLVGWYQEELKPLPPVVSPKSIDDILAGDILGRLSPGPELTPKIIADAVGTSRSGLFFAARFGITPSLLKNIVSDSPADTVAVWRTAWDLRQQTGAETITGSLLL